MEIDQGTATHRHAMASVVEVEPVPPSLPEARVRRPPGSCVFSQTGSIFDPHNLRESK